MNGISRREMLRAAVGAVAAGALSGNALGGAAAASAPKTPGTRTGGSAADASKTFPAKFLWGCATAGQQVEGNNTASDLWLLEHLPQSIFREPSGDACDHYHLYAQDIAMLADLGFNTYRFSLEWARIEPEEGAFSNAELEHYRRVLLTCKEHGLTAMVTYSHFSMPRWFAYKGAWENPDAPALFARFCERATKHLGDLIDIGSTLNEPDIPQLLSWVDLPGNNLTEMFAKAKGLVRQQLNAPAFSGLFFGEAQKTRDGLVAAHHKGFAAIKGVRPNLPLGFNLAISDDQTSGPNSRLEEKRKDVYGAWFEVARTCDYLGLQMYTRGLIGQKELPAPKGAELTQMGYEFYPECVGNVVRYAATQVKVPLYVTENGIATADDTRRVEYVQRALVSLKKAIDEGADVRGYVAWSLLDNWEWMFGYAPQFGIVAVDRATQKRTIKPSAAILGNIARRNSL